MIKNLKFQPAPWKFEDGRKEMFAHQVGTYTRDQIKNTLQNLSNDLHKGNKPARLGVAFHYKNINRWCPAIYTNVGNPVVVWDAKDSPDKEDEYKNDSIDSVMFYVINNKDDKFDHVGYKKPSKKIFENNDEKPKKKNVIDRSIFNK